MTKIDRQATYTGTKEVSAPLRFDTARLEEYLTANGGRVLGVAATAKTVAEAQSRAYAAVDKIDWQGGFCRRDIGYLAIGRQVSAE